jgi:hypothetical protein
MSPDFLDGEEVVVAADKDPKDGELCNRCTNQGRFLSFFGKINYKIW